jgi:prephenate dehydrogenase
MRLADRMTIAGVGLIGGSLAAAAREAGLVGEVLGFGRTKANLETARTRGLIDRIVTDDAAAAAADVIVSPRRSGRARRSPPASRPTRRRRRSSRRRQREGHTSLPPSKRAGPIPRASSAPTRSPERGVRRGRAKADLFVGVSAFLTPTRAPARTRSRTIRALWEGVGARSRR